MTDYSLDRGLPASPDAEKAILGAVILENNLWKEAGTELSADEFYLDAHRRIFQRINDLSEDGRPIDSLTIAEELGKNKELDAVGGVAYLSSLTDGVPRRASIEHYIRIVRDKALLRSLIHQSNATLALALEASQPAVEIIRMAQDSYTHLAMKTVEYDKDVFIGAKEFCAGPEEQIDWLVEGLIEKGSNGIAAADPKGAKSLTFAAYLAVCLALGQPWLGLSIRRRVRTGVVSREDNPSTTKRRIKQIVKGKGAHIEELEGYLYINSKKQTPSLMLDNPREVNSLIRSLLSRRIEFVILDVFNKMHSQDENDNTKIRMVMNQVDRIHAETGAQVCILHHWNKGDAGQSLTRRIRGAGAIAGFAEWIAGIEMVDEANQGRKMSFETKVGDFLKPIYYQAIEDRVHNFTKFEVVPEQV